MRHILLCCALLLAGCSLVSAEPPPSPTATQPPATLAPPTATPQPTNTPQPTATLTPTPTLAPPTATPLPTETPLPTQPLDDRVDFEASICPFSYPDTRFEIDCGYLTVPEDRSQPNSRTIRLAVAVLRSPADDPRPDPIIYLAGGPGGSALQSADIWAASPFLDERDIILVDQRGTGYSDPSLNCPEADFYFRVGLSLCRERLEREFNANLEAYNTASAAADLEDLRRILGVEQWNVFGISYGTRLALTYIRDYGTAGGVRSVVLDSVYPRDVNAFTETGANSLRAFEALFDGCATDSECSAAFPTLRTDFYTLVADLEDDPLIIEVTDPRSGFPFPYELTGYRLIDVMFRSMYRTSTIPYLPVTINDITQGDYDLIESLIVGDPPGRPNVDVARRFEFPDAFTLDLAEGFYYSVQCQEDAPFADYDEALSLLEDYQDVAGSLLAADFEYLLEICGLWDVDPIAAADREPFTSDLPTLIATGQYDPITPPRWGGIVADRFPNDTYVVFPGVGHGVLGGGRCPQGIIEDFFADPNATPDLNCLSSMDGPDFATR